MGSPRVKASRPAAAAAAILLLCAAPAGADQRSYGAMLYGVNCRACHGEAGVGDVGPRLTGPGKAATWDFQRFRAAVWGDLLRPVNPAMPHFGLTHMVPSGKPPTNDELRAIQRYLASFTLRRVEK